MISNEEMQQPNMIPVPPYEKLFTEHSVQRVVDEFVNSLDLSEIQTTYKPGGAPPYHPSVLLKVILYAYANNLFSTRSIAQLCLTDMACGWFCSFQHLSPNTINRFRTRHIGEERLMALFAQLVERLLTEGSVRFIKCASHIELERTYGDPSFTAPNPDLIKAIVDNARRAAVQA
ncbi:MAG: transposase [Muribaculaceae bacterium]